MVVEARKLSSTIKGVCQESYTDEEQQLVTDLDAFGYDEAARYVYGCDYSEWKQVHSKKATDKQMSLYKASVSIHARHDKKLLETQCEKGPATYKASTAGSKRVGFASTQIEKPSSIQNSQTNSRASPQSKKVPQPSDVCCEDIDAPSCAVSPSTGYGIPPPPKVELSLKVGVLTVSDRAANGEYEHGDLSGPAVEQSLAENLEKANSRRKELDSNKAGVNFLVKAIVGDEKDDIKKNLLQWCGKGGDGPICDLVFTTGGTGFSPRDITPEVTKEVLDKEASGLMSFVTAKCAGVQPLAALSRGTAGICGETIIVNLPGNPAAVGQVLDALIPLLLYAVKDLKGL